MRGKGTWAGQMSKGRESPHQEVGDLGEEPGFKEPTSSQVAKEEMRAKSKGGR